MRESWLETRTETEKFASFRDRFATTDCSSGSNNVNSGASGGLRHEPERAARMRSTELELSLLPPPPLSRRRFPEPEMCRTTRALNQRERAINYQREHGCRECTRQDQP